MHIAIASDHAGFEQKERLAAYIEGKGHTVFDLGPRDDSRVDYPDYARLVAEMVSSGDVERGVLICGTGLGMAIAADKLPGIRAAAVTSPEFAALGRQHNDMNVIALSGRFVDPEVNEAIVDEFLSNDFERGRHDVRVCKIGEMDSHEPSMKKSDPKVYAAIAGELRRQRESIELIASENFTSLAVLEAAGSVLTNKYAEGYPNKRYYGGCEQVDIAENLAISRATELFGAEFANVQPHSGANANFAAFSALVQPGDKVLGMDLSNGGHLTHGSPVNFSGKLYDMASYGLDPETETIDYDDVAAKAREHKPKMIIAGASAYPRAIDFARFKEIADEVGAYLLVDMAHIAGLVAGGAHQNPVEYADVVTSTSHKTLRGPRGGFILTNDEGLAKKINSAVFPGAQGGPLMHIIAAKAIAFGEALKPEFSQYIERVLRNADALGRGMTDGGLRLVSSGTDNHLLLVDLTAAGEVTGKDAERILEDVGITVNKNTIPNEQRSPFVTSGIRVGSAAITTRGFDAEESYEIGTLIAKAIFESEKDGVLTDVTNRVAELVSRHPLYPELLTFRA